MEPIVEIVTPENAGERLDAFTARIAQISRSSAQSWIEQGMVAVNDSPAAKNYKVKADDSITISVPNPVEYTVKPEPIPLEVVYEDTDLLVVNKPKGMVVHPAAGHYDDTLVNALLYHCGSSLSGINGVLRPGIVHRIDKDTSGLLIVAKSDRAHQGLAEQIQAHSFQRVYEAVAVGKFAEPEGIVHTQIGRHPTQRKKMAVLALGGKEAITHYRVLEEYPGNGHRVTYSHLRLQLETGRTHQIRVHMAYLGHPLAGDTVYGCTHPPQECRGLEGQCLHAREIGFVHPVTGETLYFSSELPAYFTDFLRKMKSN